MLAAARGLCGHKPGIACILGTGSNSCYYDGERIAANVSPLGFILGDEGSGACLGKLLVGDLLKNQLPPGTKRKVPEAVWSETGRYHRPGISEAFSESFLGGSVPVPCTKFGTPLHPYACAGQLQGFHQAERHAV